MDLEKIELEKKYGHVGYNKDSEDRSNLVQIAFKSYQNSVRYELLKELMDEVQNNSNIIELIADKYIESMNNKNDINNIEDILRDKLGYNSQLK